MLVPAARPPPEFDVLALDDARDGPSLMTRTMLESRSAMMGPDRQLWGGMLAHLKLHQATHCRQWFEEIEPLGIDGGVLRLRARSIIHRDYLQRQCGDQFNDAARTISKHHRPTEGH